MLRDVRLVTHCCANNKQSKVDRVALPCLHITLMAVMLSRENNKLTRQNP